MFIVYILCKNRKIFYRDCFCAFLAGQRSHLLIFIAVIFWIFLFLFGADFFCRKERCFRPILYRPFLYRPILRADSTKNARAHHTFTARLYLACRRAPRKAPTQKTPGASSAPERAFGNTPTKRPRFGSPQPLKTTLSGPCTANLALFTHTKGPHAKTPGVIPGVLVDEKFI